jgi:uncharacterized protein YheU (UPF0270 family)
MLSSPIDRVARCLEVAEPAKGAHPDGAPEPVVVPAAALTPDLLHAVVESFVLREGTDYGERECSLEEKVARVLAQLKKGEAQIVFDPESDSVSIVPR